MPEYEPEKRSRLRDVVSRRMEGTPPGRGRRGSASTSG
jgi:hypothetical protein